MNSWLKPIHMLMTALAMTLSLFLMPLHADQKEFLVSDFFETYDGEFRDRDLHERGMAKQIAASSATDILEKTRTGKKLNRFKQSMLNRFKFEYRKDFDTGNAAPVHPGKPSKSGASATEPQGFSFSGKLDDNASPVLEFTTRFEPVSISTRFDTLDHELDCEITSRPLNRIMGGKYGLAIKSDGTETEAVFKLKFEF
ncbi:MAG: hypothetical protein GY737_30750 [Desulfobacteraceae bacterium]|nr:hypothetical protein [Desulfobacteraceae bacterium]